MMAISVRQPWAQLIVLGLKDIENRRWSTQYRGPLLIHASKKVDEAFPWGRVRAILNWHAKQCEDFVREMKTGGIIGSVNLVDVVQESESPWFEGKHGFVLRNARPLSFVAMPGSLGIFEPTLPNVEEATHE